MKLKVGRAGFLAALFFVFMVPAAGAQKFDYHREESGVLSWNSNYLHDARSAATAGVSFFSSGFFAATDNPALLIMHGRSGGFSMGATTSGRIVSGYQYGFLNNGLLNLGEQTQFDLYLSGFSAAKHFSSLSIAAGLYESNSFCLPDFLYTEPGYRYEESYSGAENDFYIAAAMPFGGLDLGIKFSWRHGAREVSMAETYSNVITISQGEEHAIDYFMVTGGVLWDVLGSLKVGGSVEIPFGSEAERTIERHFISPYADIRQRNEAEDEFYRPTKFRLGFLFQPNSCRKESCGFSVAAEALYLIWSDYKYVSFGEELERNVENQLVLALGMEYLLPLKGIDLAFRGGYRFDPQPLDEPEVTLHHLTAGVGFKVGGVALDLGSSYIFGSMERWSPGHLQVLLTCGYDF